MVGRNAGSSRSTAATWLSRIPTARPTRRSAPTRSFSTGWCAARSTPWRPRCGAPYRWKAIRNSSCSSSGSSRDQTMADLVSILDGNTFVVSDARGDIEASLTDPTGLFSFDTRFLSRWVLTVNGQRLNALSTDDLNYFETRFFLVPGTGTVYIDSKLSVIRRREVADGFHEELTILNHDEEAVDLTVRVEAASDFADLFEVKDALQKKGSYTRRAENGRLVLGYARETFERATAITASAPAKA